MSEWKKSDIGLIPAKWDISTVDAIKSSTKHSISMGPFGSNITKDNFIDEGVPVIRGNNLTDFIFNDKDFVFVSDQKAEQLKASQCKRKDIVITHRGTLGQVGYIPEDSKFDKYIISQSGMKLTVDEEIVDSKFVFYFLKSPIGQYLLLMNASQTGVPAIAQPTTSLKAISVPIPSEHEVAEIVKTLDSIQNKINLLRRQNETLEAIAQTLVKRWFVEFEFPDENGQPYKSSGGKMVSSELGEIPEGWRVGILGDEFDILMGQSPPGKSYNEIGEGLIFFQGRTDFGFRFPTIRLYTTNPKRIADKYDVLVSVRAPVGDINIAFDKCCIGRGLSAIKSKYKSYCLYKIQSYKKIFDVFENEGTVFGALNKENFNNLENLIPLQSIIEMFDNIIQPLDRKIFNNENEIRNLTKIRNTLLPKLMSGQIRVK